MKIISKYPLRSDLSIAALEGNVALSDFESRLDEGHKCLVLAYGEHGLEEEALGVHKLGVELKLGVGVVVRSPHHFAQGLCQAAGLLPEPDDDDRLEETC